MLKIKATVASQFAQIEKGDTDSDNFSKVYLKRVKMFVKDADGIKHILNTPVITGNGLRGALRRKMTNLFLEALIKNGVAIPKNSATDFNLLNAGGGNDYQAQLLKVEQKVRELNPIISVLGTSLAVSGKISTPNANVFEIDEHNNPFVPFEVTKNSKGISFVFSPVVADETFIKKDDILQGGDNVSFLSQDEIIQWRESVDENQKARSSERSEKTTENKTKKVALQSRLKREYVIKGTDFYTYFEDINDDMTSIEKGLVYLGMEELVVSKIGSTKARGYGAFEFDIEFDDGSKLSTTVDPTTLKTSNIYKDYSKTVEEDISNAKEWLNNVSEENFLISKVLIAKK